MSRLPNRSRSLSLFLVAVLLCTTLSIAVIHGQVVSTPTLITTDTRTPLLSSTAHIQMSTRIQHTCGITTEHAVVCRESKAEGQSNAPASGYAVHVPFYCPGQEVSWVSLAEWAIANSSAKNPLFDGVTSEDKGSGLCGTTNGTNISLFWQESWTTLNDALLANDVVANAGDTPVFNSVTSFYHSHLSIDEP